MDRPPQREPTRTRRNVRCLAEYSHRNWGSGGQSWKDSSYEYQGARNKEQEKLSSLALQLLFIGRGERLEDAFFLEKRSLGIENGVF